MARRDPNRRAILQAIAMMRQSRDQLRRGAIGSFERGMAAGYHLAAHVLFREWLNISR